MGDYIDDTVVFSPTMTSMSVLCNKSANEQGQSSRILPPADAITTPTGRSAVVNCHRRSRSKYLSIDIRRASEYHQPLSSGQPRLTIKTPITAFKHLTLGPSPGGIQLKSSITAYEAVQSNFSVFNALMEHNDLLLYFTTKILLPSEFLVLYSISKPFHMRVNSHQTAYILSAVRAWALVDDPCPVAVLRPEVPPHLLSAPKLTSGRPPEILQAPDVLPFTLYREHCHMDPMLEHESSSLPPDLAQSLLQGEPGRAVPSFRYLFYITHELAAARATIRLLHEIHGIRMPADTLRTMGKLALLMHARRNSARLCLIHNMAWFTDADIFRANTLFMKLDMAFTDPLRRVKPKIAKGDIASRGRYGLGRGMRQLLCAQRGWTVCARVLARHDGHKTRLDFMRLWAEWAFFPHPSVRIASDETIWGLRPDQLGRLATEEHHGRRRGSKRLMPLEEYVVREGVRRDLEMHKWFLEMMTCGFVDPHTKGKVA